MVRQCVINFGAALPTLAYGAYLMLSESTARGKLAKNSTMHNLALLVLLRGPLLFWLDVLEVLEVLDVGAKLEEFDVPFATAAPLAAAPLAAPALHCTEPQLPYSISLPVLQPVPPCVAFKLGLRERMWLPPPQVTEQAIQVDQPPQWQLTTVMVEKAMLSSRPFPETSSQSHSCSFQPLSVFPMGMSTHLLGRAAKRMRLWPFPSGEIKNMRFFFGIMEQFHIWRVIPLPPALSKHRPGSVAHLISPAELVCGTMNLCFFGNLSLHVQICSWDPMFSPATSRHLVGCFAQRKVVHAAYLSSWSNTKSGFASTVCF